MSDSRDTRPGIPGAPDRRPAPREARRRLSWVHRRAGADPGSRPPAYRAMAEVYDHALGEPFHGVFRPVLDAALEKHAPPGRRAADLGCGTGILALRLASEGWSVTGVDSSPSMLGIAREKMSREGALVDLQEADLRSFNLAAPVDAAFAAYDTLNHILTPMDLLGVFRRISASLRPGGYLYADTNCRAAYRDIWSDPSPFVREGDDYRLEIRSTFDVPARLGRAHVDVWTGPSLAGHAVEEVHQRFFLDEEIQGSMWAGGLEPVDRIPFDILPPGECSEEPMKALWVARRRP